MIGPMGVAGSSSRLRASVSVSTVTPLANKPAGLSTVVDWDCADTIPTADGAIGSSGMSVVGNSAGQATYVTNQDGPQNSPSAIQLLYPDGQEAGGGMPSIYTSISASDKVYVAIWAKWETGFEWNTSSTKFIILQENDVHLQSYTGGGYLVSYESGSSLLTNSNPPANLADDQWHYVEFYVDGTTGAVSIWLDGEVVRTGAPADISTTGGYISVRVPDGTWGGVTAAKSGDSYMWVDHIHVATGN